MADLNSIENQSSEYPDNIALLLDEVNHVLSFSARRDKETLALFGPSSSVASGKNSRFQKSDNHSLSDEEKIRQLCVRYRLRFLSVKLFSGEVPYEVIASIKAYDHQHSERVIQYYILAPSAFFLLRNQYAAPLLFASLGQGHFELICQWGEKLPWYIPLIRYPYRDFRSMVLSSIVFGFFVALLAAFAGILNYDSLFKSILLKVPVLILSSGIFSTTALCYGLATHTDFSSENWNSRFFH